MSAVPQKVSLYPPRTLRRLRDYYRASGELNRADDIEIELVNRHSIELAELHAALGEEVPPPERP
jgi:hypothetical protein